MDDLPSKRVHEEGEATRIELCTRGDRVGTIAILVMFTLFWAPFLPFVPNLAAAGWLVGGGAFLTALSWSMVRPYLQQWHSELVADESGLTLHKEADVAWELPWSRIDHVFVPYSARAGTIQFKSASGEVLGAVVIISDGAATKALFRRVPESIDIRRETNRATLRPFGWHLFLAAGCIPGIGSLVWAYQLIAQPAQTPSLGLWLVFGGLALITVSMLNIPVVIFYARHQAQPLEVSLREKLKLALPDLSLRTFLKEPSGDARFVYPEPLRGYTLKKSLRLSGVLMAFMTVFFGVNPIWFMTMPSKLPNPHWREEVIFFSIFPCLLIWLFVYLTRWYLKMARLLRSINHALILRSGEWFVEADGQVMPAKLSEVKEHPRQMDSFSGLYRASLVAETALGRSLFDPASMTRADS